LADVFLGVPFNIASYALLTHMIAHVSNLKVGDFVHTFGDAHIYTNHIEQVKMQLQRKPMNLPKIELNNSVNNLFDFQYEDIKIIDYESHPHIKAKVAV
jgi:thymidylate synthase